MAADDPRATVPGAPFLTTEELRRDVSALREILQARLDGMDRAAVVLSETVNRTPTEIQTQIAHLKELHDEKFRSIEAQSGEKFSSVELQFKERDERSAQLAKSSADALEAALKAAKELGVAQTEANVQANAKTEVAFAQQLKAVTDKIEVINGRLDRGEGNASGASAARDAIGVNVNTVIQALALLVSVIVVVIFLAIHH